MGTTGQSITLANSIIGVGILAMPFCFQQCGVVLATLILLLMGLVSRLCCHFLLKSALLARRRNFEFLAFHVFGPAGKFAVEVGIIGFLMGTCIAYFVVVGDLGPQIIAKMFNINQSDILRTSIMVIVSLVCVLPLGLLRNVDSLSNVSAATIGFYFCLVIKVIAEAASLLLSGEWHTHVEMWKPSGVMQCVPIFSMALFCQTQLFEIFESLPSLSLEKMNVVTKNAINICTGVYFTLGLFGYIAFSSQTISGNILMSLSPTMANDVIKLGFVMSLAFSFPLIIFPCRASLYSFLYKKVHASHHDHIVNQSIPVVAFRVITVSIVAAALCVSLLIPNIELVLGLVGATIGVLVCLVFPAACFLNLTFKDTNERLLAKAVVVLGLVILVLGTCANLQAAENSADKYDDGITREHIDKIVEDFFESRKNSEEVMAKPVKSDEIRKEDVGKINKEVVKDSEVQPPNPVPPESISAEKKHIEDVKNIQEAKKVDSIVDKVSESHPKNLKTKLNGAKINSAENIIEKKNIEKSVEEANPPIVHDKTQEKIDMMKQQQLIETIKQHGEEQKQLIQEQKVILDEILKTKQEMEQNKKEVESKEANKIAVESIQKIANMAIQKLSGVTDKPAEAVQEIAQQAVESIKAINDVKEKSKEQAVKSDNGKGDNAQQSNSVVNPVPVVQNILPNNHNPNPQQNINNLDSVKAPAVIPNVNIQPQVQNGNNPPPVVQTINGNQQAEGNNARPVRNLQSIENNHGQHVASNNVIPNQPDAPVVSNNIASNQLLPVAHNNVIPNQSGPQAGLYNVGSNQPVAQLYANNVSSNQPVAQVASNNVASFQPVAQPPANHQPFAQPPPNNIGSIQPMAQLPTNNQSVAQLAANNVGSNQPVAKYVPNNGGFNQPVADLPVNNQPAAQLAANNVGSIKSAAQIPGNNQLVEQLAANYVGSNKPVGHLNPNDVGSNQPVAQVIPNNVGSIQPVAQFPAHNPPVVQLTANDGGSNQPVAQLAPNNVGSNQPVPHIPPKPVEQMAPNNNQQIQSVLQNNLQLEQNQMNLNLPVEKVHSHSPDEPQSYIQGEDTQKKSTDEFNPHKNYVQNVPLPIAMNGNSQAYNNQVNRNKENTDLEKLNNIKEANNNLHVQNGINNVQTNGALNNDNVLSNIDNAVPIRQKREVVDCTEKTLLKPEDKQICDIMLSNNLVLPKTLPLHHARSLKSYEETERRR